MHEISDQTAPLDPLAATARSDRCPAPGQRLVSWWHRRRPPDADAGATSRAAMPELPVWMTCMDGHEYAVTDDNVWAGFEVGRGTYDAVCGQRITPQSLTWPPEPRCAAYCTMLQA
ncbi:MAG: hypothetical protein ACRDRH_17100 [Pseudonocardia sp.]